MSLLLDARKKIELAMEQTGVHKAVEPQLSETLRLEDTPDAAQRAAPVRDAPDGVPFTAARGDPRAAGQNLFAAKAAPSRAGGRLGIIPIALISGAVIAAGGGYYVWREISPAPVMQRQAPMPPPAQPIANAAPPAVPVMQTAPAHAIPAVESAHAQANVDINPDYPLGVGRALDRHAGLKPDLQSIDFVGAVPANEQSGIKQIDHVSKVAAPHTPPAAPHDTAAQPIRIEHGQQQGDSVDPTLLAAWQAYRNGEFRSAWQLYGDVLKKDGKNRDALLGMAAIAQQQSQDDAAAHYYRQVLVLDPRDPIAHAGISALSGASYAEGAESRLKLLLSQQPRSAALHFALGNLYAEQSRWGDAQQSYFSACNLEPDNAQFAFNLAVSLDHLGKSKLAAQYYRHALQQDTSDNAGFDRAQTQRRINDLMVAP